MSNDRTVLNLVRLAAEADFEREDVSWLKSVLPKLFLGAAVFLVNSTSGNLSAQTQNIEHWTAREGFPSSPVASITQTHDGVLWLGTRNGLVRFDGSGFTLFTRQNLPDLASMAINNVATGQDSQLYVGTDSGLTVVRHGRVRTFQQHTGTVSNHVLAVLPAGEDEAWFGTTVGVLCHYVHGAVEEIGSDILPRESIYGLAKAPDGSLWMATAAGLFVRRNGKVAPYMPAAPLPVRPIFGLAISKSGHIFAASHAGLFEIEGPNWKLRNEKDGLPSDSLNILDMDTQGVLWIGTRHGLAKLENGAMRQVPAINCDVKSVFADKEQSVWVGCEDVAGLTRVTSPPIKFLSVPQTPGAVVISSLVEDRDEAIWMGSNVGVFRYHQGRFRHYTRRNGLPSDDINAISISSTGALWVATDCGLASFGEGRFETLPIDKKEHLNSFYTVLQDRQGTLWATSEQGLLRRRAGEEILEALPDVMNSITSLREDREGGVLVNTYTQGLLRFSGESRTAFTQTSGLGSNRVLDSVQDSTGTIWAWTDGGLSRIRAGQCANLGPGRGLPRGSEGSIAYDRNNHLWLRTQDGTAVVDIAEANHVLDSRGSLRNTRFFERVNAFGDGLSNSPSWNPIARRSSGEIWVPSLAGIAIVDPAILQQTFPRAAPQVTSLVTDQGPRDIAAPVKVQPGDVHLQIAYMVPNLLGTLSRQYRYRMVGFDTDWRDNGTKEEAVYAALPAGTYHFQASSRLPFEAWSEASVPIELIVLPHFYQTWWWYAVVGLLFCSLLATAYRLKLRALRRQYAVMLDVRLQERSRLARELHDTLSQGMMAIHVHIQLVRALLRNEPDAAFSHLDAAESITRQSASETRRSITALRSDQHGAMTLRETLGRAISRFRENSEIPLDLSTDDDLPEVSEEVSHEIARVVEEALANVRRHSGAAQAFLFARRFGKKLRIEVLDNGKGFALSALRNAHPDHFGVTGMKERAQRIRSTLEINSVPGKGTRVILEVPFLTTERKNRAFLFG